MASTSVVRLSHDRDAAKQEGGSTVVPYSWAPKREPVFYHEPLPAINTRPLIQFCERVPGDGEDYDADWGVDDDEAIDGIDEDIADDSSGDDSDIGPAEGSTTKARLHTATKRMLGLSLHSRASSATASPDHTSRSVTVSPTRVRALSAVSTISSDSELQVALMPSLFPYVPPTINFVLDGQKVESLPWEIRRMLKWRLSPITPNVVKQCIARSHFKITRRSYDWIGYFGKHMKAQGFKAIREYQKVNHFPGSFQMGRKDRLWRNLSRMQVHYGKREFNFFPQTFVLPIDAKLLKRAWDEGGNRHKWIIKPPASARGIGIRVVHKWNQIPKRRQVIVQRYLSRPYLINGSKFDLRLYVYITSYDPLRIYLYDDGLVRFASCKYSYSTKTLSNRYMHLTNYSINKRNDGYKQNDDENVCQGHKWALKALWGYLKKYGINTTAIWENIKDIILKTVISSETFINSLVKSNVRRRYSCHELFGFDVFLDETLKPWIIEVNISPSLHSNSPLDMTIKGGMVKDMLNIAGFQIPDRSEVVSVPWLPAPT
ncbi:hypothetical protein NP493_421g01044 [Ridgeia piscesae]|uniref:Tubulin polyglutamylase TTLL4 n=1 Tax=Ridgeia piscesae TaxID=27915 RepID=A0AAD9L038_RIDPI|nr:hypothetical protein NP493_421g01044 [Ridgeia piscesae]